MYLNVIDVVILLGIAIGAVTGFKRGVFKQLVMTVGTLFVFYLAFKLKDPVADFLCLNLPFFDFPGSFQGISVINIIMYQFIAFLILLVILLTLLNVVIKITGIFEKILKFTIILGLPSKLLGLVVGAIEGFVVIFIILFFLSQPAVNLPLINESKLTPKILNHTPLLSNVVKDTYKGIMDIYSLKDKFDKGENKNEFNLATLDVLLNKKLVKVESIDKLVEKNKLKNMENIDSVLSRYR